MKYSTSVLLATLLAGTAYAWPPSSDTPTDNIYAGGCSAATGTVPSSLLQTINNDFNDENSAVSQMYDHPTRLTFQLWKSKYTHKAHSKAHLYSFWV